MRAQLAEANARIAELTTEVGRLAALVAKGNERVGELLAVAQRKSRGRDTGKVKEPSLTPDDPLAKTVRDDRNHWDALFRFVDHPEIPPDNSASEREYQHVAKMRGACLVAGSTEGAHRTATLLGIVATCCNNGVDPLAYLAWAFTRLGTHRDVYQLRTAPQKKVNDRLPRPPLALLLVGYRPASMRPPRA